MRYPPGPQGRAGHQAQKAQAAPSPRWRREARAAIVVRSEEAVVQLGECQGEEVGVRWRGQPIVGGSACSKPHSLT